jgi:DNA-binding MarR family transcriptional regulator
VPSKKSSASNSHKAPRKLAEFDLDTVPGYLIRRCNQRAEEIFSSTVGADKPTRQQVAILFAAIQNPGASQAELGNAVGTDKNTLARIIGMLVERGLLARERSGSDAREYKITATPAAVKLLESLLPAFGRVQEQLLASVPEAQRAQFIACLKLVAGVV